MHFCPIYAQTPCIYTGNSLRMQPDCLSSAAKRMFTTFTASFSFLVSVYAIKPTAAIKPISLHAINYTMLFAKYTHNSQVSCYKNHRQIQPAVGDAKRRSSQSDRSVIQNLSGHNTVNAAKFFKYLHVIIMTSVIYNTYEYHSYIIFTSVRLFFVELMVISAHPTRLSCEHGTNSVNRPLNQFVRVAISHHNSICIYMYVYILFAFFTTRNGSVIN